MMNETRKCPYCWGDVTFGVPEDPKDFLESLNAMLPIGTLFPWTIKCQLWAIQQNIDIFLNKKEEVITVQEQSPRLPIEKGNSSVQEAEEAPSGP